jgi:hypothetical protein
MSLKDLATELLVESAATDALEAATTVTEIVSDNSATKPSHDIKPGDYVVNLAGHTTRIDSVDEGGNLLTVWNVPILAADITVGNIKKFEPILPTEGKKPFIKCIDGSNTRSILFEGLTYRINSLYDNKYVEIVGAPGLFPLDIFTVVE